MASTLRSQVCEQERRDKTTSYLVGSLWEVWSLVAVGAVVHTAHYDAGSLQ